MVFRLGFRRVRRNWHSAGGVRAAYPIFNFNFSPILMYVFVFFSTLLSLHASMRYPPLFVAILRNFARGRSPPLPKTTRSSFLLRDSKLAIPKIRATSKYRWKLKLGLWTCMSGNTVAPKSLQMFHFCLAHEVHAK